ncbi:uncharacterized protein LOC116845709 [Odontomachus brunneus]|uniref:uncharacterized protein LOC116845709 n=1 Tax=Odontomachus brunneus TaxID=486640 RepID=UPI0013F21A18|nr:uncharacterized protein LOC116845709 [Odontomachus brunneus]
MIADFHIAFCARDRHHAYYHVSIILRISEVFFITMNKRKSAELRKVEKKMKKYQRILNFWQWESADGIEVSLPMSSPTLDLADLVQEKENVPEDFSIESDESAQSSSLSQDSELHLLLHESAVGDNTLSDLRLTLPI